MKEKNDDKSLDVDMHKCRTLILIAILIEILIVVLIYPIFGNPIEQTSLYYLFSTVAQAIAAVFALLVAILSFKQSQIIREISDLEKELNSIFLRNSSRFLKMHSYPELIDNSTSQEEEETKEEASIKIKINILKAYWHHGAKRRFITLSL